jgi:single-stranded DNA-binding protein
VDLNVVLLSGVLAAATERTVGQQGRTLVEPRLAVARPGRTGEGAAQTVLPITIWAGDVGAAVCAVPEGTPLTVVGRLQAREWNNRLYLELIAESVTVDVSVAPETAARELGPEPPAAPSSPSGSRPRDVPF